MTATSFCKQNVLLSRLTPQVKQAWSSKLKKIDLAVGKPIGYAGQPMEHAYFPADSIIAVVNGTRDGLTLSTAMIGREGIFGVNTLLGDGLPSFTAIVQAGGTAYRLPMKDLLGCFHSCPTLRQSLLHYTMTLIRQMEQVAVSERHHSIDQRFCRWMVLSLDRLQTNKLTITQELVAQLLGVRREGISEAATRLQRAGAIQYRRGQIHVLNRPLLEDRAWPIELGTCPTGHV